MTDPYHVWTERAARAERFEEAREARRRFEPVYHERKTMTHYELLQACRAVRDNLGRTGTISVNCRASEEYRSTRCIYENELDWTISYHDEGGAKRHIQVSSVASAEVALVSWTEEMRQAFGPAPRVPESELAATLDAHRVAENAA